MPTNISLDEFHLILGTIGTIKKIGLIKPFSYIVTWEKKPQLTLNKLGEFEFENPQEVYGCVVTFWKDDGTVLSKTRFIIGG